MKTIIFLMVFLAMQHVVWAGNSYIFETTYTKERQEKDAQLYIRERGMSVNNQDMLLKILAWGLVIVGTVMLIQSIDEDSGGPKCPLPPGQAGICWE